MIKILRLGKTVEQLKEEEKKSHTMIRLCHRCLSDIQFDRDDLQNGRNEPYVQCPNCGEYIEYDYRDDD